MPLGKVSDVRPDPVLTRLAVELGVGAPYVADVIAPVATVEADSFRYATWGREDIKSDVKSERAPGAPAARVELSKTHATASVHYYGLKSDIPDELRNNDPTGGTLDARRTRVLTNKLRLEIEDRVSTLLETASNTIVAPVPKWDATGATIRKNILDAKNTFRQQAGFTPNVVVIPPAVAAVVFNDTAILDLIKHTHAGLLAEGLIPMIDNMQVVVPGGIIDASNPGAAAQIADIYASDEVYFLFVDQTAGSDLSAQTALRQVRSIASTGTPFAAMRWRDPDESSHTDWVAVEVNQVELVLSQAMILRQLNVLT